MKFSYNWLKEHVPALPKPNKLGEVLTMHAFEVESITRLGKDHVLDVKILPNRIADASGHMGLAREIAAILGARVVIKTKKLKEGRQQLKDVVVAEVKTPLCRRYTLRGMMGVRVKKSPGWIQERLLACGLRPINNIVDATNYVMLETGQPLHAFDADTIGGKKIIVRMARKGETIDALDDNTYNLDESIVVIADTNRAMVIAGIKGGEDAGISADTKDIVIEAATFDGPTIRMASQRLMLRTDASVRFSVGMDPNLAGEALERAVLLIQEVAGGVVLNGCVDIYPKRISELKILLRPVYVNSLLGTNLRDTDMITILKRLEFGVSQKKQELLVTVPTRRVDITMEEDLIEEIGRLYGLEHMKPRHPVGELIPPAENQSLAMQERMRDMFQGIGFQEVYNYSFVGEKDIMAVGDNADSYLQLENPTRAEFAYMRASLGAGLLKNAAENIKHENGVRFFEMGHVFRCDGFVHKESVHVAGIMAETSLQRSQTLFFELKGALSLFFEALGVDAWFDPPRVDERQQVEAGDTPPPCHMVLHPHRPSLIKIGDEKIGVMGEVHPRVLAACGVSGTAVLFELDADLLGRIAQKEMEFRPISRFPSVMRDIALLVPLDTRMVEVEDVIENTGGELLVDTDLVDLYEGAELPDGKKNFAFRLMFQAEDRTLKDEEVNTIMERITKTLEAENSEWEVRK